MKLCGLALLAALAPSCALGGAGAADEHDEHNPDTGPTYFGFVKDASGVPVRDAKVSASYKGGVNFLTRTNATGAYKLSVFKKDVKPEEVVISCSKEGYRQVRVFRYPLPKGKPVTSVETECRLQRQP
jgi:hypothetical protein